MYCRETTLEREKRVCYDTGCTLRLILFCSGFNFILYATWPLSLSVTLA